MGQILHGSAKTTHAVRAAIQRSKASIQELARRYDLNPKTVMKWRKRAFLYDAPMGPKVPRSTVLSAEEFDRRVCGEDLLVARRVEMPPAALVKKHSPIAKVSDVHGDRRPRARAGQYARESLPQGAFSMRSHRGGGQRSHGGLDSCAPHHARHVVDRGARKLALFRAAGERGWREDAGRASRQHGLWAHRCACHSSPRH